MEEKSECRACLKIQANKNIFVQHKHLDNLSYSDIIFISTSIMISLEDIYPKNICLDCCRKLEVSYEFRKLCQATNEYLIKSHGSNLVKEEKLVKVEENNTEYGWITFQDAESHLEDADEDAKPIIELTKQLKDTKTKQKKSNRLKNVEIAEATESKDEVKGIPKIVKKKKRKNQKEILKCSYCTKTFAKKLKLKLHEDIHLGIKRYFCDICQKSFRNKWNHEAIHKSTKEFKCNDCHKTFRNIFLLRAHEPIHDPNRKKSFTCDFQGCEKSYTSSAGLFFHRKRFHSDVSGSCVCHICSKVLSSVYSLKEHLIRHQNKDLKCNYCDKMFFTDAATKYHEKKHGEKKYSCTSCDKLFLHNHLLKRHMKLHESFKEVCKFCNKTFARVDYVTRHIRKVHETEIENK